MREKTGKDMEADPFYIAFERNYLYFAHAHSRLICLHHHFVGLHSAVASEIPAALLIQFAQILISSGSNHDKALAYD